VSVPRPSLALTVAEAVKAVKELLTSAFKLMERLQRTEPSRGDEELSCPLPQPSSSTGPPGARAAST
jgi:hypothetical protein